MTEAKKKNLIRWLIWGALILAAFLIQSTSGLKLTVGSANISLVLPLLSCICMFEKEKYACWFGLFAGFLMDMVSPVMVGYNALIMLILSTLLGLISTNYFRNTLLTNFASGLVFIFLNESLYWLFFIEFKQTSGSTGAYLSVYLPSILISSLFIVPIFFIVRAINKKFKSEN